jgi:hypothetical protein
MPRIKIVEVFGKEFCDDDFYDRFYIPQNITDWDDVTDGDLKILLDWASRRNYDARINWKVVIIVDRGIGIPKTVKQCLAEVKTENEKRLAAEKVKREAIEKRQKKAQQKRAAKEKKLLVELQDKYGK